MGVLFCAGFEVTHHVPAVIRLTVDGQTVGYCGECFVRQIAAKKKPPPAPVEPPAKPA